MQPDISVVVPTYRRPGMLARCLRALTEQDLAPERYEIVVCDDGPEAIVQALVERFATIGRAKGLQIRYVPVIGTQGPAAARNLGWRVACAAILAFTDDDTVPEQGWLSAGLAAFRAPSVAAAAGRIVIPLPPSPTDYELDASRMSRAEFATANCFVRRSALETVGGFDERYTAAWREDSDLQFSILETGGAIASVPSAIVVHPVRPAPWAVSLTQARKSQFEALLFKKHRAQYRSRIASPPWSYYGIALSAALCVASLIAGAPGAALMSFAIWVSLTVRFATLRLLHTSWAPSHIAEMIFTSIVLPPMAVGWRLYGALKYKVAFL